MAMTDTEARPTTAAQTPRTGRGPRRGGAEVSHEEDLDLLTAALIGLTVGVGVTLLFRAAMPSRGSGSRGMSLAWRARLRAGHGAGTTAEWKWLRTCRWTVSASSCVIISRPRRLRSKTLSRGNCRISANRFVAGAGGWAFSIWGAAALAVLLLLLTPGTAHAWTPGTHVFLGDAVLRSLSMLP